MAMTYSSLKTDIQTWAENTGTDFTSQLDTFIDNTFDSLSRDIDPIGFNENVTTTAVAGDRFVNLPTSIEPMLFNYLTITVGSNVSYLELKTLAFCQEYWPDISIQGQPKYFANFDDDLSFLNSPISLPGEKDFLPLPLIIMHLKSLFLDTTFLFTQSIALSKTFLSGANSGLVNTEKDLRM